MTWRTVPQNDDWRAVTVGKAALAGEMLWMHCYCGRRRFVKAVDLMAEIRSSCIHTTAQ
jgi:pentatricopeptide repeat protein